MFLRLSNRLQLTYYFVFVRFELFTKLQLKPNWKISFNETKNWQTICLKIKLKKWTFSLPNNYFIKKLCRFLFLKQCQKNDLPYKFGICPINASFFSFVPIIPIIITIYFRFSCLFVCFCKYMEWKNHK